MPDNADKDQKTERASRHKLKKSREQGQVAKSQDLSAMTALLAAIFAISIFSPQICLELKNLFTVLVRDIALNEAGQIGFSNIIKTSIDTFLRTALPVLLIVWLAALVSTVAQVGLKVSWKPLEPNIDKINPVNGFGRLFSMRSTVQTALALAKMLLVVAVSGSVIWNKRYAFVTMGFQDINVILKESAAITWEVAIKAALTLLLLAIVDFAYQRWQFLEDQKMTKQEVKEEYKQMEGNPFLKGQIKSRQKSFSQKRGLKESVKTADVVVTNPFHIAVAIKYDRKDAQAAPKVVAKGARLLAERIKNFAREANIDVIQNIPVARALYKNVAVDQEITPDLYIAVAEVLAVVYAKEGKDPKKRK